MQIKEQAVKKLLLTALVTALVIFPISPVISRVEIQNHSKHAALPPHGLPDTPSSSGRLDRELAKGKFLVATKNIKDPRFAETVILLVDYSQNGTLGLIVNRPTDMRLSQVFSDIEGLDKVSDPIYIGGPVERNQLFMLIQSGSQPEDAHLVFDNIYVSSSSNLLRRIVDNPGAGERFRIYAGYAGWAPGQLEREIARGDWYILQGDAEIIFDNAPMEIWKRIMNQKLNLQVRL